MLLRKTTLSRKNLSLLIWWTSILLVSENNWIYKKLFELKNLEGIIYYYHNHVSILKIRSSNNTQSSLFNFNLVSSDEIKRHILIINNKKVSREGDTPINILKDAFDTYLAILNKVINSSIE